MNPRFRINRSASGWEAKKVKTPTKPCAAAAFRILVQNKKLNAMLLITRQNKTTQLRTTSLKAIAINYQESTSSRSNNKLLPKL
jgi:hypothetical protein